MSEPTSYDILRAPAAGAPRATIEAVQEAVCRQHQLARRRLIGPERCRSIAHPRAIAMYLARVLAGASYLEIGRAFGGRNHVTVMVAARKIVRLMGERGEFRTEIGDLTRLIVEAPRRAA